MQNLLSSWINYRPSVSARFRSLMAHRTSLLLGLLLFLIGSAFRPAHEFHVSTTEIEYAPDREQVQITIHLFIDDLELALMAAGAPKLYIGTPDEMQQTSQHLSRYLEKNFRLSWNQQYLPTGMLGYEISDDMQALFVYLSANTKQPMQHIQVENTVLTEIYDDQKNIVKVRGKQGKKRTTFLLSRDKPAAEHIF